MTLTEFRDLYPEFRPTADAMLTAHMAAAELQVSDSWGVERDSVVGLTCAALLAAGPQGRAAQLQAKDGSSTYSRQLAERQQGHACCYLRTGVV